MEAENDPEYQAFVNSMMKFCVCEYDRPCDSVLAGGPCDTRKRDERLDDVVWDDDYDPDDEGWVAVESRELSGAVET